MEGQAGEKKDYFVAFSICLRIHSEYNFDFSGLT